MKASGSNQHDSSLAAGAAPLVLDVRVVTGAGGGPDKTILNSPRYLAELGYANLCAYMRPPRDPGFDRLVELAESLDAPLTAVDDRGPWDLRVVWQLLRLCRQHRVAIWHGHDYKSNALGLVLRKFHPMRLVTTVHGWVKLTRRTPVYYGIDRFCLRYYERVIPVSEDLRQRCLAAGVAPERCLLLNNGIDTERYQRRTTPAEARRALGLPDRPLIGAVGRLSEEKGFADLIRAAALLRDEGRDATLAIVGDGDQQEALAALAAELGLGDRVRLVGYSSDTLAWYQAMDVFALSSLREGLPNVLLEAMAMEVPVVATRVAGVPNLVVHNETGLLVEPGESGQLAAALGKLLDEPPLRIRLASEARQTVSDHYSFEQRMQRIGAIYDELLGRNGQREPRDIAAGRQA